MILEQFQISLDKYKALRYATEAVYIHKLPEREQKMSKRAHAHKKKKIQEILRRTENQFLK